MNLWIHVALNSLSLSPPRLEGCSSEKIIEAKVYASIVVAAGIMFFSVYPCFIVSKKWKLWLDSSNRGGILCGVFGFVVLVGFIFFPIAWSKGWLHALWSATCLLLVTIASVAVGCVAFCLKGKGRYSGNEYKCGWFAKSTGITGFGSYSDHELEHMLSVRSTPGPVSTGRHSSGMHHSQNLSDRELGNIRLELEKRKK